MTYYDLNMNSKSITNLTSFSGSNQMIVNYGNTTATTAGKLYYLDASNNWIEATNSNSAGFQLAVANGSSSSVNGMIVQGTITNATYYSAFSVGGALYVSSTSGLMTNTAPSSSIRVLGNSLGSNQIFFSPSNILSLPTGMSGYGIATGAGTSGYTTSSITDPSLNNTAYQLLRWTATTGTNTMTVSTAGLFEIFVLGGGGGAGNNSSSGSGGGGGAGQLVKQTVYLDVGAYTIIVGAGGSVGTAGSGTGTRSGNRGGYSAICPTTPAYPKIIAVGGGGGMASSAGGGNSALNSYARTTLFCDSYCGGGGASPQTQSNEVVDYGVFSPTNVFGGNQIGFGDNTLTTGGFFGGTGYNNSNYSATGGGGGIGGVGGDYTQVGGQETMRGGAGGLGIYDTFTGAIVGYAGGGCGGHATTQAIQTSLYGGGSGCNTSTVATAGTANTGGGGGGGANQNLNGGSGQSGGSGVVMVRYRI